MCTRKIIQGFLTLIKRVLLLANDIYSVCLFYILNILFKYKV